MTYPVRMVTPNAATETLNAQQARQAVRNAMPALPSRDASSPLERFAQTQVQPVSTTCATPLEEALFAAAPLYQYSGRVLIWHLNTTTGEFTGFSLGGKLNAGE